MKVSYKPSIYSKVACDLASKIASGTLAEGERFSGRSLMSTQYSVSPETIRRALKMLSDMGIIEVRENIGSRVLSKQRAREYVEHFEVQRSLLEQRGELARLLEERKMLDERITEAINQITDLSDRFRSSDRLRTYEFLIREQSAIAGKTISDIQFRQRTGATIVALKSVDKVTLSPAPQSVLRVGDTLVVACDISMVETVVEFVNSAAQV